MISGSFLLLFICIFPISVENAMAAVPGANTNSEMFACVTRCAVLVS